MVMVRKFMMSCLVVLLTVVSLYAQEERLKEIVVEEKLDVEKLALNIARNFMSKYKGQYASGILHYRALLSKDKCIEFNALQGIAFVPKTSFRTKGWYWDNKAIWSCIAPLTVMRSNAYTPDGNVLEQQAVDSNDKRVGYNNRLASPGYQLYSSIQLFSPLNKKMVKYYDYEILKQYQNEKGEICVLIRFRTDSDPFQRGKTRLCGEGTILYNISRKYPVEIYMKDYIDLYTGFVRTMPSAFKGLSTNHNITVRFACEQDNIFLSKIKLEVEWPEETPGKKGLLYFLCKNPRRNPYKHNLRQVECFEYSDHMVLEREMAERLEHYIHKEHMNFTSFYCAPYDSGKWKNVKFEGMDINKIKRDLYIQVPFEEQAAKNALTSYEERMEGADAKLLEFSQKYYLNAIKASEILFDNK